MTNDMELDEESAPQRIAASSVFATLSQPYPSSSATTSPRETLSFATANTALSTKTANAKEMASAAALSSAAMKSQRPQSLSDE